ncbi:NAD(P)/FAD-dependent oxidoreductase [Derxia lacustris]|uniref:NAD(P)/FAD-dependent oxidoreductase n=1 Tax=Derxia lacustris TaxID=764842 RepID=UPI000A16EBCE|nr:NAD(P)-binding protein [Derxia lacustris]
MARRIAIVGGGVAGLGCLWRLREATAPGALDLALYEREPAPGGHANTVDVVIDGQPVAIDTGFLVFNHHTYPQLTRLFESLGVATTATTMSFSVQTQHAGRALEWAGSGLGGLLAQPRNALSADFWRMLADIARFNRAARALAADARADDEPLGGWLDRHGYSALFIDGYLLPMAGAIWSCPTARMREFPVATLARFCANHGLLQMIDQPPWRTVTGGSRRYVQALLARCPAGRRGAAVALRRTPDGVQLTGADGSVERFDAVVLATHSDQSLALLDAPAADERALLGAIGWQRNRTLLHLDASLLPRARRAWAAWNYRADSAVDGHGSPARIGVDYLINRLQPLPVQRPVIVSLNPVREPMAGTVLGEFDYAHPVFDAAAVAAQRRLGQIQGRGGVWHAGAWTGNGFHEAGLTSGMASADAVLRALDAGVGSGAERRQAHV